MAYKHDQKISSEQFVDLLNARSRLPAIYFQKEFVDEGGLMSYGVDYDDLFRRSAQYVDGAPRSAAIEAFANEVMQPLRIFDEVRVSNKP